MTARNRDRRVPAAEPRLPRDQPFWAKRLHALGAATALIPRTKVTVSALADAIRAAVDEPAPRAAATALSSTIAGEDGAAAVVAAVERAITIS